MSIKLIASGDTFGEMITKVLEGDNEKKALL